MVFALCMLGLVFVELTGLCRLCVLLNGYRGCGRRRVAVAAANYSKLY
jgi:SpoVK/Ycf46/Vps4 family AAA+-type ATPase